MIVTKPRVNDATCATSFIKTEINLITTGRYFSLSLYSTISSQALHEKDVRMVKVRQESERK